MAALLYSLFSLVFSVPVHYDCDYVVNLIQHSLYSFIILFSFADPSHSFGLDSDGHSGHKPFVINV